MGRQNAARRRDESTGILAADFPSPLGEGQGEGLAASKFSTFSFLGSTPNTRHPTPYTLIIQWASHPASALVQHVRVNHCGPHVFMAE